ncbi:MAG: glycoside hydrolase family 25 protein [Lachnospiraceae bacterium]|nr:glycoside hydrolase family 25 protein [Lachnospiraceae bacterium]
MSDAPVSNSKRKRRKKRNNLNYILEIILCLIALSAITFSLIFLVKYRQISEEKAELQARVDVYEDPEDPYLARSEADALIAAEHDAAYEQGNADGEVEVLNKLKNELMGSDSSVETLKQFYPDDLIVFDENHFKFFPILDSLVHHPFEDADFSVSDKNRIVYNGSAASTETWIDVSKFQEKINWGKVSDDGIDAAIIRVGYRGYSQGDIMDDETFEDNIEGALDNDIKAGVYFLTQATSEAEAKEEAEYVLDRIEPYDISCPVVIDVEMVGGDDGRGNQLSMEERTKYVKIFLDTIKAAGYETCIYGNLKTFLLMLDMQQLEDYSKWFAGYTEVPYFPYEMDMWQYTDTGSVSGISGNVDINIRFVR